MTSGDVTINSAVASQGAFAGLVILEIGHEATQACGKYFADMGATVVKVEPPGGAPSLTPRSLQGRDTGCQRQRPLLGLQHEQGERDAGSRRSADRTVLRSLALEADVILEDHPPGYLDQLGRRATSTSPRPSRR